MTDSTLSIPAGHVGFVLPLGGFDFVLTGSAAVIARVASIVATMVVVADDFTAADVAALGGVVTMGMGTGGGQDFVSGHYLAIDALRRAMSVDRASRRLPSVASIATN